MQTNRKKLRSEKTRTAACALAVGLLLSAPAMAEGWITTTFNKCQVWSADDSNAEAASWTGQCLDGKASGDGVLVVTDKSGLLGVYEGEIKAGRLHGSGFLTMRNEDGVDSYDGDFAHGTLDGEGLLVSSHGWSYDGDFKDGKQDGTGTIENNNGDSYRSAFKDGQPVGAALVYYKTDEGDEYFGEAENGKRHGNGHLVRSNRDVYNGEFESGVAAGMGTYDAAEGGVYVGMFDDGKSNGFGTYIAANGDVYQGRFVDGKAHGQMLVTRGEEQSIETWDNGEKK